ncbi:MAG: hypothetical protein M3P45_08085 [Acidobacteriota bacterium]|nr:hypothetical protein [Acidobacteriota bacterium]
MNVGHVTWGLCLGATMIFSTIAVAAGDKIPELQARFDRESNPLHRAHLLEKLGNAQFDETRRAFKANDMVTVGIVLEKYRDNARVALEGLRRKHADAERDGRGYRQLEIHVRRGIREVDEILLMAPEQYQPPLRIVRNDLDAMDTELIHLLFRYRSAEPPSSMPPEAKP